MSAPGLKLGWGSSEGGVDVCACVSEEGSGEDVGGLRGEPCSGARKGFVERLLLPGQVWVLWQLPTSVPNIVKSSNPLAQHLLARGSLS